MTETPLKPVELKACPWCQKPMAITGGCNPIGRCDTENCWMHERKMAVAVDSPFMVEQWNTRTVDTELLEALKAVRSYGCPVCSGDCGSANPPVIYCPMQAIDTAITKAEAGS